MLSTTHEVHLPLRKVVAVGVGNALAFYDFLTFSFFAIQIGRTFFPAGDATHSLLYSLATFGVGFATRPVGGLVIGMFADRAGRKPAMILAFALMGAGIVGVALTPSYAQIGVAAPVLLVLFRLLQGFALSSLLAPADLDHWGWRAAFLIGAAIVPVGLIMRRNLPETHAGPASDAPKARTPRRLIVIGLGLLGSAMTSAYVLDYTTTYAQDSLHLTATVAFGATIVLGATSIVADIAAGLLTDRVGRRPVMLTAVILFILLAIPAYMAMVRFPSVGVVYAVAALIATLVAFTSGPGLISLTEALPKGVRSGAVGTIYAVAVAGFGGTTQFTIKWLTAVTGNPVAPAWYLTAALVMGAVAIWFMHETAPVKTGVMEDA